MMKKERDREIEREHAHLHIHTHTHTHTQTHTHAHTHTNAHTHTHPFLFHMQASYKNGLNLIAAINCFVENLTTLVSRTMADTFCTWTEYQQARLEYDSEATDLNALRQKGASESAVRESQVSGGRRGKKKRGKREGDCVCVCVCMYVCVCMHVCLCLFPPFTLFPDSHISICIFYVHFTGKHRQSTANTQRCAWPLENETPASRRKQGLEGKHLQNEKNYASLQAVSFPFLYFLFWSFVDQGHEKATGVAQRCNNRVFHWRSGTIFKTSHLIFF